MEETILYRATGKGSKDQCQAYMDKWVLPVDADAYLEQNDTTKGESWVVMGTKKLARKLQTVIPK